MEEEPDAKNKLKVEEKELKDLRSKYGKAVSEKYRALRVASVELSAKLKAIQVELAEIKKEYSLFEGEKYTKPLGDLNLKLRNFHRTHDLNQTINRSRFE